VNRTPRIGLVCDTHGLLRPQALAQLRTGRSRIDLVPVDSALGRADGAGARPWRLATSQTPGSGEVLGYHPDQPRCHRPLNSIAPMDLLFVYGSLKEGFPNAHVNTGRRQPGSFRTRERLPFYLVGAGRLPCLVLQPGQGLQVLGQLFQVKAADLAAMDRVERVDDPQGYRRVRIGVEHVDDGSVFDAFAYVQPAARLDPAQTMIGPLAEYTPDHARHLHW
jgi:gamma-glutamylaminecyclotransferase